MTSEAARARWTRLADKQADRFGVLLLMVLTTYVLASLFRYRGWAGVLIAAIGVFTAFYGLLSARVRPRLLVWCARTVGLVILLAVVSAALSQEAIDGAGALLMTILFVVSAGAVLRGVVTESRITAATIAGAISVYIMLSILFAFVYIGLDAVQATPFFGKTPIQNGDFLFFSMTTLTTTGYGNLVPAIQPGRMLAAMEMLLGQIFVVTLIARLVSGWQPGEWLRQGAGLTRRFDRRDS